MLPGCGGVGIGTSGANMRWTCTKRGPEKRGQPMTSGKAPIHTVHDDGHH